MKFSPRVNRVLTSVLAISLMTGPAFAGSFNYQVPVNGINLDAATAGQLTLNPGSKDFGTVILGGSAGVSVTVSNSGQDSVTLSGIEVSAPYAQTNNCPGVLVGGATCSMAVTFVPTAAGEFSGALTLNNSAATAVMPISGRAVVPTTNLGLSDSALNFNAVKVGETSTVQRLTVTNNGNSPATVNGIGVSTGGTDFSQANNCGSVLNPGESCAVNVSFAPTAYGARAGTLNVYEEVSGTLYSVALQGFGNAAVLAVSPSTLVYGDTVVGYPGTQKVTVTNTGNELLSGLSTNISTAEFNVATSTCSAVLAAGDSCELSVAFAPNSAGNKATTLNVTAGNAASRTVSLSGKANAQAPSLSATPVPVVFSALNVGSSDTRTFVVANTGNVPVTVSGLSVVSGAADFTQSNTCATVPVGSSCSVEVRFAPSARGARTGAVYLAYGAGHDLTVGLSGQGLQGVTSLSAATVDFGSVMRDQAAAAKTLTLTNTGDAPLTVDSVGVLVTTDFKATSGCTTLAVGASCNVTLNFTPTALGVRDTSLTVKTNAGDQSVTLKGIGVKGQASISPSALTFNNQQVATSSAAQTVTVTNTGSTTLQFTGVSVVSGATDFAQSNNCASVAVGASCSVSVGFTPSASGTRTGSVALTHDGDGVSVIALTGLGQAQSASITQPTYVSQQVGTGASGVATLTNTGVGPLSITVPTAASVTGSAFTFSATTCPASLAVGASCTTTVIFNPSAPGSYSGALAISTGGGVQTATLTGNGVQGTAAVAPNSLTFAAQQVATTASVQTVTVTNTGTSALVFSGVGIASGGTDFAQSNNCASIPVNGTCSISVSFTPSAAGARTGTVAMTHNGGGITTVSLSGTGQAQSASLTTPSFASTPVGSSTTATATLSNTGIGALSVSVPAAASVSGTDFSFVSTTCGASLAVSGTCSVTVRFSPTSTAARSGSLAVSTGAGVQAVTLGSTGIQGYATVSPSSLPFAAQQVSTSSGAQVVTVTNTGTNTLTFTGVGLAAGSADFGQSNNCGSVAVNGTCTISVVFTPSTSGTRTGTLALTHNGGGIATVSLTGTAQAASAALSAPTFANTQVGQTTSATATLTNTGIAVISVTTPTAAAVTGTDFSFVSTTCGTSLAANATCTVSMRFAPTSGVARSGSLAISTSAGTQTAALNATGVNASVGSIGPLSFSYNVAQNTGSGHGITVQNTGVGPVTVNSLAYTTSSGSFNAWWVGAGSGAVGGYCENGMVLQPGQSCNAWVNGDGAAGSTSSGTATISTSAGSLVFSGSFTVKGIGYSGGTGATLAPTAGQSGTLYNLSIVNSTPFAYYFPMYTVYGGASRVGRFIGTNAGNFVITSTTCGGTLAAGASCTVAIAGTGLSSNGTYSAEFQPNGSYQQGGDGGGWPWSNGLWLVNMGTVTGDVYVSPTTAVNATVQSAALSYNPTSLAFGNVQVGQSSSKTFTITNTGNITATGLTGVQVPGYSMTGSGASPCSSSLAAGATCTATAVFTPTAVQAYTSNYGSSGSNIATAYMPVSGSGVAPSVTLTGFNAGGNSALGTIGRFSDSGRWPVYKNTGIAPVTISAHSVTGAFWAWQADPSNAGTCYPGLTLAVGATCTTFVGLNAEVGDYSGTETLSYTGTGASTSYAINTGYTGSVRTTTANVSSVAFGTQGQNQWNGPMYVRITNNATGNVLRSLSVSLSGGNAGNFRIGSFNCSGGGLSGGEYCDIPVYFNPTWSANGFSTSLVITGGYPRMDATETGYINSTGVSMSIPLTGNGAFSQATVTSANAQDFGGGWYGQSYAGLNWTYRNDGNVNMSLASPSVSAPLVVNSNSCSNIAPGASCTIQLGNQWNNDSAPTSQNFAVSGATINPATATVYYTVYSAVPVWGNTNIAFGNVTVGSSSTIPVTLYNYGSHTPYNWAANNGVANLPADFSVNLGNCSSVAQGGGSAQQGGSCTAYVTFTPSVTGARGGGSVYVAAASYGISGTWANFSGTGVQSVAPFTISSPSVGSTTLTWTVYNPGAATTITGIADKDGLRYYDDGSTAGTCHVNATLGAGASCTVIMTYSKSKTNPCPSFDNQAAIVSNPAGSTTSPSGSIRVNASACS